MAISFGLVSSFSPPLTASFGVFQGSAPVRTLTSNHRALLSAPISAVSKPDTETVKRGPKGIMKPRHVSPEMQAFLGGVSEISRTQALKEIWAHIKLHNLQDPTNRKIILCDEKLKKIFGGKDQVGFLEIAGLLNPHFLK